MTNLKKATRPTETTAWGPRGMRHPSRGAKRYNPDDENLRTGLGNREGTAENSVNDHGSLTGLGDDDHPQYHNDSRGDVRYYTKTQSDSIFATKSDSNHTHTLSQITDAGTAASKNVPASGDAAAGEVVQGNDTRLTNARTPTSHTHPISEVTALQSTLDGKAAASHTHALSEITDAGTAASRNVSATGDASATEVVKGNDSRLTDARTPTSHTHAISDTTGLQTALDGKAAATHSHAISDVTGLQTSLDAKELSANKGIAGGYASLDGSGKVPSAQLPAFVDDVLEVADYASLPVTGATGVLYVTLDNDKVYRWTGSTYAEISPSPGSTDSVPEGSVNKYYTEARVSANTDVVANTAARHSHSNKALLDTYTQTEADLADAVSKKHAHANQATLDATTSAFTTAQESKLSGIEDLADVTDAGNVGSSIHGATAKTTPIDADEVPLIDSAASNVLKKVTWANIKATLKTYFDTLYEATGLSLLKANNLSDLPNAATARTNLGLGSLATQSGTFSGTSSGTNTGDQNDHNAMTNLTTGDVHTQYTYGAGRSGGQSVYGGTAASENLYLYSTSHATKGKIYFGDYSAYDVTNLFLGVGITTPEDSLHVQKSGSAMNILLDNYTSSGRAALTFRRAIGTVGSPSAVPGGYILGDFVAHGYQGSGSWGEAAAIRFGSVSPFTSTSSEGRITFYTTPNGSTTAVERMRINSTGDTGIGQNVPTARLDIKTETSYGKRAVSINQVDSSQPFINFVGTSGSGTSTSITTRTVATIAGFIQIEINGTKKWIAYYNDPTA